MNLEDALKLTQGFPEEKTVPKKLADAITESSGEEQKLLMQLGEGVVMDAITDADRKLVMKYLMN